MYVSQYKTENINLRFIFFVAPVEFDLKKKLVYFNLSCFVKKKYIYTRFSSKLKIYWSNATKKKFHTPESLTCINHKINALAWRGYKKYIFWSLKWSFRCAQKKWNELSCVDFATTLKYIILYTYNSFCYDCFFSSHVFQTYIWYILYYTMFRCLFFSFKKNV